MNQINRQKAIRQYSGCFFNKKEKEKCSMRLTDGKKEKEMTKEMMIEKIRKLNKSTHENIEQKKKALNIMVNAVQVGGKILALIPVEDLKIDESYQRPLQSHVLAIANE